MYDNFRSKQHFSLKTNKQKCQHAWFALVLLEVISLMHGYAVMLMLRNVWHSVKLINTIG